MANIFGINRPNNTIALGTTGTITSIGFKHIAGSQASPVDVTNARQYGIELHYSGNNYNVTAIRARAQLITTDTSASAQGALLQAANNNNINAGVLNGALIEAIGKATTNAATITMMRGCLVNTEWSAKDTITDLRVLHVRTHTRDAATEGYVSDTGYGIYIENEAVGGNGQALDAGIYFKGTNLSVGNKAFTYGLDFSGATYGTTEIKLVDGGTIGSTGASLNIDSSGNVSIGINDGDGTLHVHTATAGTVIAHANADDLVIENNDSGGITILTPNNKFGNIFFGDPEDNDVGRIYYNHQTGVNTLNFVTNGSLALTLDSFQNASMKGALRVDGTLKLKEQADADGDVAGYGQLWTNLATPNELWFTNDAGTDFILSAATNYVDSSGVQKFTGTGRIGWTKITANGVAIRNSHGTTSDSVSDLQTAHDGNVYTLSEESGETPGMDIEVDFTGVTAFNWVQILARYEQTTAGHGITIMLEITPFNGSAWHRYDFMQDQGADLTNEEHSFFVPDDAAYINNGVVKVRFVHEMGGTSSNHDLVIDVCALYQ